MATSAVARVNRPTTKSWGVIADADADVTLVVPHGMGALPNFSAADLQIKVTNLLAAARVSDWVAAADATNVTLTKTTTAGSGDPGEQALLMVALPHTIV